MTPGSTLSSLSREEAVISTSRLLGFPQVVALRSAHWKQFFDQKTEFALKQKKMSDM